MPNQPKTVARTVRVPDELWDAVTAQARERGETVSDVVRRALKRYVQHTDRPTQSPAGSARRAGP